MSVETKPKQLPPLLVVCFGILVASTAAVFIRFAQEEANSIVIAAYRLSMATLILLPVVLRRHRQELFELKPNQVRLIILSGIFLALHFATWISSLAYTTVASSVVLVSTTPLWVALLSPVFLHERPTRWVVIGMMVSLVGVTVVGISEACQFQDWTLVCPPANLFFEGRAFWGNILAIAGALTAAAYLLVGRWLRSTLSLMVYITTVYGVAAVALILMAIFSGSPLGGFALPVYLAFLALAVGPQLLGHTSLNYGLRYLSAAFVSVILLGEPISSTILAFIILKETPTLIEMAGGIVILVGIYLASRSQAVAVEPKRTAQAQSNLEQFDSVKN